jgi:hypothetical protein
MLHEEIGNVLHSLKHVTVQAHAAMRCAHDPPINPINVKATSQ